MANTKKQQANTPRRKRYNRNTRLQNAKKWAEQYNGENLVKDYSKWFGVNLLCAITELEMLGYQIKQSYKDQIKQSIAAGKKQMENRKQTKELTNDFEDDAFYFIAGYTENRVPFGLTWEEMEGNPKTHENRLKEPSSKWNDDHMPF